jgi:putative glutamine amidotransferase
MLVVLSCSSLKDNYAIWLQHLYPGIELADASSAGKRPLAEALQHCSGILLTGGPDVHPSQYGMAAEASRCEGIDEKRDQLELDLVENALEKKIPLLAICRGIQLVNIGFRGSLIVDIPSDHGRTVIHHDKEDVFHAITVANDSELFTYGKDYHFVVNSSHHQAIKTPGEGLVPVSWSEDGLIEAIELDQRFSHPFFTGVQWHPERLDTLHPMSGPVGKAFLQKAAYYSAVSK